MWNLVKGPRIISEQKIAHHRKMSDLGAQPPTQAAWDPAIDHTKWTQDRKKLHDRWRVVWIELQSKVPSPRRKPIRLCCEVSWRMDHAPATSKMIKGETTIHPIITANSMTNPYISTLLFHPVTIFGPQRMREVGFLIRCSADYSWIQLGLIKND